MAKAHSHADSDQDTRHRLLGAATEIFAKKGFAGATVKEIADQAGVNISLISYHFKGKEGIFQACLEGFVKERLRDAEAVLQPPESPEDLRVKLRLWMQQFLRCHVEEKSVCTILHRENVMENDFMWELFESTFAKTFEAVVKFLESGRKKGILRKDVDTTTATHLLIGFMVHLGRNQEAMQRRDGASIADSKFRAHMGDQAISILLSGILKESL